MLICIVYLFVCLPDILSFFPFYTLCVTYYLFFRYKKTRLDSIRDATLHNPVVHFYLQNGTSKVKTTTLLYSNKIQRNPRRHFHFSFLSFPFSANAILPLGRDNRHCIVC
mmetsp:Transcript_3035/g.3610  ORF Transcript_3035/g.3610 Transcript_3035/m.3610 type:complete len:110 (-) Transcript_3035:472-801(-)